MTEIPTAHLGGEKIGGVAIGAMQMGTRTPPAESARMLDRFLDSGGTMIDTANAYAWWSRPGSTGGESEEFLGRWLATDGRRDRVFLSTKIAANPRDHARVWTDGRPDWDKAHRDFEGAAAAVVHREVDACLRRLRTDRIDLLYVHVDDRRTPLPETLAALADVVETGKVRHLGWSNVRAWRLERIRALAEAHGWPGPVAVQQCHTYLRPRGGQAHPWAPGVVDDEMLDYLRERDDLTLVSYSPILKGAYDDPSRADKQDILDGYAGPRNDARLAALRAVAAEVGATPNQTVLAWLLRADRPPVVPLIGPRTPGQLDDALGALAVRLSDDQMARLDGA